MSASSSLLIQIIKFGKIYSWLKFHVIKSPKYAMKRALGDFARNSFITSQLAKRKKMIQITIFHNSGLLKIYFTAEPVAENLKWNSFQYCIHVKLDFLIFKKKSRKK